MPGQLTSLDALVYVMGQQTGSLEQPNLSLGMISSLTGAAHVPLFSSRERFDAVMPEGTPYAALPLRALVSAWPGGLPAVIDPGSQDELILSAEQLRAMISYGTEVVQTLPAESQILVAPPRESWNSLVADLATICRSEETVREATVAAVTLDEGDGGTQAVVALEIESSARADEEVVVRRLVTATAALATKVPLSFTVVGDPGSNALGGLVRQIGRSLKGPHHLGPRIKPPR